MSEYTYESIITNPMRNGIENLIGKDVYVSDVPSYCLWNANENDSEYLATLIDIKKDHVYPFIVKRQNINYEEAYSCIIMKEEEPKPVFAPFENQKEFVIAYQKFKESLKHGTFEYDLADCGMWLKHKYTKSCSMVIEIGSNGVTFGGDLMLTSWRELFEYHTFIDGSPCGKEVKDE